MNKTNQLYYLVLSQEFEDLFGEVTLMAGELQYVDCRIDCLHTSTFFYI